MKDAFGEVIKSIRLNKLKVGLRNFADSVDIAYKEYSDYERGIKTPDMKTFKNICKALNIEEGSSEMDSLLDKAEKQALNGTKRGEKRGFVALACTISGKCLNEKELLELNDYVKRFY
jgi:transcriptional regulator with XRE-family HTH domain